MFGIILHEILCFYTYILTDFYYRLSPYLRLHYAFDRFMSSHPYTRMTNMMYCHTNKSFMQEA